MSWELKDFVFLFVAVFTISHAVVVVTNKNLVRSAFALLFCLLGVAGLYVFAGADFLAAIQVLIYVGGISILFLFAIMLTSHVTRVEEAGKLQRIPLGFMVCLGVGIVLAILIFSPWPVSQQAHETTVTAIGNSLLDDYLLPFEIISLLLIMAMIGAVMIARTEQAAVMLPDNPAEREADTEERAESAKQERDLEGEVE